MAGIENVKNLFASSQPIDRVRGHRVPWRSWAMAASFLSLIGMIFSPSLYTSAYSYTTEDSLDASSLNGIMIISISTRYDPEVGSFHLFGEILNNMKDSSAADIEITATFYESGITSSNDNIVISNMSGSPYINFLNPGEQSAFELIAYGNVASNLANFSYYHVLPKWENAQETRPGFLNLSVGSIVLDPCGNYHIAGTVSNYGKYTTSDVVISAAFYNNRNQIVASSFIKLGEDRKTLAPTDSAPFVFVIDKSALMHFAQYSINVHSANYSAFSSDMASGRASDLSSSATDDQSRVPPNIMISSDSSIYGLGKSIIKIAGSVHYPPATLGNSFAENISPAGDDSLVLIKVMTAANNIVKKVTAPVSANGSFYRSIDFFSLDESEGQVYIISANYKGAIAENTFAIGYNRSNNGVGDGFDTSDQTASKTSSLDKDCNEMIASPVSMDQHVFPAGVDNYYDRADSDDIGHIYSPSGNVEKINVGTPVVLSATATNEISRPQQFVIVIEVSDSLGSTILLHIDNSTLDPGPDSIYQSTVNWYPSETGLFMIKTFAISGFDEPRILSSVLQVKVNVV